MLLVLALSAFFLICAYSLFKKRRLGTACISLFLGSYLLLEDVPITRSLATKLLSLIGLAPASFWQLISVLLFLAIIIFGLSYMVGLKPRR